MNTNKTFLKILYFVYNVLFGLLAKIVTYVFKKKLGYLPASASQFIEHGSATAKVLEREIKDEDNISNYGIGA